MRAKKCDRCGKLYEHYDGNKEFKNTEKANALFLIDRLCPDCMKNLEEFLLRD